VASRVKLNFDEGSLVIILRDHDRNVLLVGAKHCRGFAGSSLEEARPCLDGLICAHEGGLRNGIIKSNCLELMQMLKNNSAHDNFTGLFVRGIISFVENFDFHS